MSVNVEVSELGLRTYKELQEIAKACNIPANIRKEQLRKAIKAHYEKNKEILQGVLDEVKHARAKRKKAKVSARPRSKSKNKSLDDGSDDNVDSTSGSSKELVPFNQYTNSNMERSLSVDQSYLTDRRLYERQHSAYLDNAGQYDSRLNYSVDSALPSNHLQSNYMASSNAMLQYNGLQKDTMQNYSEYNASNYPSYHSSSYYRQSCPSFSWMGNPSYFSMRDSYYASQMPATKLFEPKVVLDCTKSYGVSKSGYYGAESNGVSPLEVECSSNLLPNVPQLDTNYENHVNGGSSSWNRNPAVPTHPNRVQFSPADLYTYQQNEFPDESFNFPAADNESISAEIDSASEADNRSLADDIADLLSMDGMDVDQDPAAMDLLMSSEFSRAEQSLSTLNNKKAYYTGSSGGNHTDANSLTSEALDTSWSQSLQNVENGHATEALPSQTSQIGNVGFQLPTFSTLLPNSNTATEQNRVYSDYQSSSKDPRDSSPPNGSQPFSQSTNSSCTPGCSQDTGYGGTDGTLSSSNNGVSYVERVEDTSYQDDQSHNEYSEIIDLDASPEAPTIAAAVWHSSSHPISDTTHERTTYAIENTNGCDGNETCDDDVEIVETQPGTVGTANVVSTNEARSQTAEGSGLIYEKETLHRSKIICDSTATNNIKENVVHELVKIFIPNDGQKAIFSQTTTRKKISDEVPNSSYNACQLQVLRKHLETRACWYKSVGCTFEGKSQLVATHEKRCKFQSVYCPSESCTWREPFNGLIEHINDVHKEQIIDRQQFVYTIDLVMIKDKRSFHTFYQVHKGTIYVIRVHIEEEKCVATVQYVPDVHGNIIRLKNFKGIMEFVGFPDKRRVKIWKGYIQPYSDFIDKYRTFNTMRIEVDGCEFITLYVSIF